MNLILVSTLSWKCTSDNDTNQGCNRNIFSEGAKSFFLIFFSRREMLFPGTKFPFW